MLAVFVIALCLFAVTTALPCPKNVTAIPFPQFQIVAAAKTGSTSLFSYLCQHPDIHCIARKKETNLLRSSKLKVNSEQVILSCEIGSQLIFFSGTQENIRMVSPHRFQCV